MVTDAVIRVENLNKVYDTGFEALKGINLDIKRGEIFALLGPNGAGKTTLISIICGIVNPSSGKITADGHDIIKDYRQARAKIGLVPQELTTDAFESVMSTVKFSRGMFGKAPNDGYLEKILKDLSLFNKKDSKIVQLSGGMKRRVMIAKALSHEPEILFLDEPTAGVDVELRRDMWKMVRSLRDKGVTIILTTHYIEEAQEMADRIGIINDGKLMLVEEKQTLLTKLGKRRLTVQLKHPLAHLPQELEPYKLEVSDDKTEVTYHFDTEAERGGIAGLMKELSALRLEIKDLRTKESSLEDIFVDLVEGKP